MDRVSVLGVLLAIVGLVVILMDPRGAMTRFLRYWLLRMVYEQRDLARQHTPSPDD
jgi:hypothetical protein